MAFLGFTGSEWKGAGIVIIGGIVMGLAIYFSGILCTGGTYQYCPDGTTIKATCVNGSWQESGEC